MPGFTTHYIMGMKAYNDLPFNQLKHIISKYRWLYQLGLQGPDMFFYNLPILRHRDDRNVGSHMHEHQVADFFANYLSAAMDIRSRQQREQALAYFCGFVCHYICDSICHPFIYGRILYDTDRPTLRHHGLHAELENEIDALLLEKYKKKKPSQFNQAATICLNPQETQFLSDFLSSCINQTYYQHENHFQVTPRMVHRSILAMRFGCRTLADPSGHKRDRIEFVESKFLRNPIISSKIVSDHVPDPKKSLNLRHETWYNPWDHQLASTASFPDLFHQSIDKCCRIFVLMNSMYQKNSSGIKSEDMNLSVIITELGNYSYHSGLPADT